MENERPKTPIPVNSLDNYPNASISKGGDSMEKPKPKTKQEAIVDSELVSVKKQSAWRKAKHRIFEEEGSELKSYVSEVLIQALKNTISDVVTNGIDILLFGEARGPRRSSSAGGGTRYGNYVSYNSISSRSGPSVRSSLGSSSALRNRLSLDDFIFQTRTDAERILDRLSTILCDYGIVTVADLYDLCGLTVPYTYHNYAWKDLSNADVTLTRDGYLLNLPTPQVLD